MLLMQINRKEGPRSYKRNFNSFEKKAFKIQAGLCLYRTKTLDTIAAQGFESRRSPNFFRISSCNWKTCVYQ